MFIAPIAVSVLALAAVGWWGGVAAFLLTAMLAVLEVTLSFDNAVVNAKVLKEMSEVWQRRFLTWGILLSVVGTRLILPILIVSIVAFISPFVITTLAFTNPAEYSRLLLSADASIKAFGGAFLLMVALKFFVDEGKTIHWIASVEKRLAKWGNIEAIEASFAMLVLVALSFFAHFSAETVLRSGIIGIVLFTITEGVAHGLNVESKHVVRSGAVMFIYLNVLDTAFSLDGVIGAFALTTALPIIVVGLGIGAYFVRSLTVYLVRAKTLDTLVYLEHGAHWAILGLSMAMFAGLVVHVPEILTAGIGLGFILLSYYSSRREIKAH
ncbi:DUF475 domain-containing protein [Patescibacteria group bacterium]|nr:DUF475 domain-containing protein [Patescibacteria group bacterium]